MSGSKDVAKFFRLGGFGGSKISVQVWWNSKIKVIETDACRLDRVLSSNLLSNFQTIVFWDISISAIISKDRRIQANFKHGLYQP